MQKQGPSFVATYSGPAYQTAAGFASHASKLITLVPILTALEKMCFNLTDDGWAMRGAKVGETVADTGGRSHEYEKVSQVHP